MAEVFATKPRDEWVAVLGPADTCVSAVNTVAEAVGDEQYAARGAIADAIDATAGAFRQAAPIWAGTVAPDGAYEIRDGAVTDTAQLLEAAGFETRRIDALLQDGAIA